MGGPAHRVSEGAHDAVARVAGPDDSTERIVLGRRLNIVSGMRNSHAF